MMIQKFTGNITWAYKTTRILILRIFLSDSSVIETEPINRNIIRILNITSNIIIIIKT